jgi:capsular polysaccharide export protein
MTWGANKDGLTVEDGFIRSMGLSPDQYFPFSLAVDSLGIHYDPKHTSELEEMLKNRDKLSPLIERAKKLRKLIVEHGVTKYNLSEKTWQRPEGNKNVILVVGQVPSDASIKLGAIDIKTDSELIKIIRLSQPDAYMIYKPHPDVEAGIRKKDRGFNSINYLVNEIVSRVDMNCLFSQIDELHTITSLTGFEALLRGVKTFCYGMPFYSGWGLTVDRHSFDRRNVKLTIDELVAAALIKYPIYIDSKTGRYTTPETIIGRILEKKKDKNARVHHTLARLLTGIYNLHKLDR